MCYDEHKSYQGSFQQGKEQTPWKKKDGISFFPKAWKYTPTTLMESASLLIGTKSIEDYGIAVLITILLVVICLIVSITVMNRKQL